MKRWQNEVNAGKVPSVSGIELFGGGGWPLFSKKIRDKIIQLSDSVDQVLMLVPDFRIGNRVIQEIDNDVLFSNKYKFIDKDLISNSNDQTLYNNAIKCLDWYVQNYGDKIKFCFWCLFFREKINIKQGRYLCDGGYLHPTWNYADLIKRYSDNIIDLNPISSDYENFIVSDGTVHPNENGYAFLSWLAVKYERNLSGGFGQLRDADDFYHEIGEDNLKKGIVISAISSRLTDKQTELIGKKFEKDVFFDKLDALGAKFVQRNLRKISLLKFEFPVSIGKSTRYDFTVGRHTYLGSGRYNGLDKIGRYCSVANDVAIGLESHPLSFLSTSPVCYDPKGFLSHFSGDQETELFFRNSKESLSNSFAQFSEVYSGPKVVIGNDVWIGHGAFIKRGVTVGDGAVIAAHSVVTKDVPPYSIVGGVPAKIIRHRFSEEIINKLLKLKWWDYSLDLLCGIDFSNIEVAIDVLSIRIESGEYLPQHQLLFSIDDRSNNKGASLSKV